jgi:hypothetical protein
MSVSTLLHVVQPVEYLPWISILEPSSCYVLILLIYVQFEILEMFLQFVAHEEAGGTSTNADDFDMAFGVDRCIQPIGDGPVGNTKWRDNVRHVEFWE